MIMEEKQPMTNEQLEAAINSARAKETFHSTARQAAQIAKEAHVKRLVIGHYSARYEELDQLKQEADSLFPGTILGNEGLRLTL